MDHSQSQRLGQAVFRSLADQAAKAVAGLVPGGAIVYDLVKGVYDEIEKSQYVTHEQLRTALLALTDQDRARLREEALADSELLTLDEQRRLRATMAVVEQQLFTQLLAEAEQRDAIAARAEANAAIQRLRATLAEQLQRSRYSAALKTSYRLASLTPNDVDLLKTQKQLEEKLSNTFVKQVAGAFCGCLIGGFLGGWLWAFTDWVDNGPKICTTPALYPAYPGQCLVFGHPPFPMATYLDRMILFGLAVAVVGGAIAIAVEGPRRWRRDRVLRHDDTGLG